ncbi:MAG TPA: FKBP-type peptidyl-prolyl cis-trans isomerase [Steroidobacteraceae bacterium]|nr:FKBP-type peptidyl-prolyl cis-trans isomerase [Steroidobacteraceae bacterium]
MNKARRASTMIVALVGVSSIAPGLGGCAPARAPATQATAPEDQVAELQVQDIVVGQGAQATAGARVTVHYTGWLYDGEAPENKGKEFDSSRRGGKPFSFTLGARQVIAGWDQGVAGMRAGGQRRLVIPSALAYGDEGAGGVIPPKATLVFDVALIDVRPSS